MKIINIKTELKYIALKTPFITALRRVVTIELVRISIICDNNLIAYGEAPSTMAVTGEDIESILTSINNIRDDLISLTPEDAITTLHLSSIGSSAKAALDMAFVSLIDNFYTKKDIKLQTDVTISLKNSYAMLIDAAAAMKNGMKILKIKFGADIEHAIEVTKKLSNLNTKLIIDANQAWSLEDTFRYIDATRDVKIELIEQPVGASELDLLKTITNYSDIPIVADESVFTLEDAKKVMESKSADIINVKLMKCGGVTKAIEILEYAREKNLKCMLGSMLEGPISINAALNLAMEYSDVIKYVDLDSPLLYEEVSDELEFEFNTCEIRRKSD